MKSDSQTDVLTLPAVDARSAGSSGDGNGSNDGDPRVERVLTALLAFRNGDFSQRLPAEWTGVYGKIADTFNDVLMTSARRASEMTRVCRMVGKEGRLQQRMAVPGVTGGWADEI